MNPHFTFPPAFRAAVAFLAYMAMSLSNAFADEQPSTPPARSKERKAIVDALRVPVEKDLKMKVIFKIELLHVLGDWAFLQGIPLKPDSSPMDYSRSQYAEAIKEGMFEEGLRALLRKRAGAWQVITFNIGATDVVQAGWDQEFGAPAALWEMEDAAE